MSFGKTESAFSYCQPNCSIASLENRHNIGTPMRRNQFIILSRQPAKKFGADFSQWPVDYDLGKLNKFVEDPVIYVLFHPEPRSRQLRQFVGAVMLMLVGIPAELPEHWSLRAKVLFIVVRPARHIIIEPAVQPGKTVLDIANVKNSERSF